MTDQEFCSKLLDLIDEASPTQLRDTLQEIIDYVYLTFEDKSLLELIHDSLASKPPKLR